MVSFDHAIKAREVFINFDVAQPGLEEQRTDGKALRVADLDQNRARRLQPLARLGEDEPIGLQPIRAAIEGKTRVVILNLNRQPVDLGRSDIGRVGDDEIEAFAGLQRLEP
jgi:hypothetical protein